MKPIFFYKAIPEMHLLSGDTLPAFTVHITDAEMTENMTMKMLLTQQHLPGVTVLEKEMTRVEDGFTAVLKTSDTQALHGAYWLDFVLSDGQKMQYKKLRGALIVDEAGG